MSDELKFTGERFVPGTLGEIWYEHWHRYHFAALLATGRKVLDVASGEGYGSALLALHAATVIGADISAEAVEHASARYASQPNLSFRKADCAALPFGDGSFDLVVSFETIEHIAPQESFLDEVRRVLAPDGVLILSCPNKIEYSAKSDVVNPFHCREHSREELAELLAPRFAHTAWYGQRPGFFSIVWPEEGPASAEIFEVSAASADSPTPGHARPLYFIVAASNRAESIAVSAPRLSVLADRDESIYRDYERLTREVFAARQQAVDLQREVAASRARVAEATDGEGRMRLQAQIERQEREIRRRASIRWWLALPLHRLRAALAGRPIDS